MKIAMNCNYQKLGILILTIFVSMSCPFPKNRPVFPLRLIDHLTFKDIVTSPFLWREKCITKVTQEWKQEKLSPFFFQGRKYYLVTTDFPVFIEGQSQLSEAISLRVNERKIPLLENPQRKMGWLLRKGEAKFSGFKIGEKQLNAYPLGKFKKWTSKILLPEGLFQLRCELNFNHLQHLPLKLKLVVNGKIADEALINMPGMVVFIGKATVGLNELMLVFETDQSEADSSHSSLVINNISIKSQKDLIMVSLPDNVVTKKFKLFATYFPEPVDVIVPIRRGILVNQNYTRSISIPQIGKISLEILGYSTRPGVILKAKGERIDHVFDCDLIKGNLSRLFLTTNKKEITLKLSALHTKNNHIKNKQNSFYLSGLIVKNNLRDQIFFINNIMKTALNYDYGIKENPFGLKKKIVILYKENGVKIDETISIIFAPPNSIYTWSLYLPKSAGLEFGFGVAKEFIDDLYSSGEVNFKIILEDGKEEQVIFDRNLSLSSQKVFPLHHRSKVDLSRYGGRKVTIKFLTTSNNFNNNLLPDNQPFLSNCAYWENPTIFKLKQDNQDRSSPNIILISIDTLRKDHLSCYGYPRKTAPNLEKLAKEGILFTKAFSSTSWTLPAHVSLLTGLDNRHHLVSKENPKINQSIITLADYLRVNGYTTIAITGGGLVSSRFGFSKGFEIYKEYVNSAQLMNSARLLAADFAKWIKRNKNRKFFTFLHTYQTHLPYFSPKPYNLRFMKGKRIIWRKVNLKVLFVSKKPETFRNPTPEERKNIIALYDGEIRFTDEKLIKLIINLLKDLDLYEKTMIVITSDHGEEFFERQAWLHGHSLYNELIQIPLIIKFPHQKYFNFSLDKPVRITDIMPTILEEASIKYDSGSLDGQSIIPLLKGKRETRLALADLNSKKYPPKLPARISIYKHPYKLIMNNDFHLSLEKFRPVPPPIAELELYDLEKDPQEKQNIAPLCPEITRELIEKINKLYLKDMRQLVSPQEKNLNKEELEKRLRALGYIR